MHSKQRLRAVRRSDAGFCPDLSKRRHWYSEPDEADNDTPTTPDEANTDNPATSDTLTLSRTAFNTRLQRAKNVAINDFVIGMGYDDAAALKTALEATSQVNDLQSKITELETQLQLLNDASEKSKREEHQTMLNKLATSAGAREAEHLVAIIRKDITEDDTEDTINAKIIQLRKDKPYLFNIGPGTPSSNHNEQPPTADTKEWAKKAMKF